MSIARSTAMAFAAGTLLLAGCASAVLAPRIVSAPNTAGQRPAFFSDNLEARVALSQLYALTFRVPVGPPTAELSVGVIAPGDYRHEHALMVNTGYDPTLPRYFVNTRWEARTPDGLRSEPKGTIILLHGFWMSKDTILHWGIRLAEAGYRTVPVDLRAHGSSTGAWVTFGANEAADLMKVLDELRHRGLADERVGVLGISYGASVGLLWAGGDPRVRSVVALEPFSDPRVAIRQYARAMLSPAVNRALSDRSIAAATARAARLASFSWSDIDVGKAVAALTAPVLFIHGSKDTVLPVEHSRTLHALAPAGSRLIEAAGDDHFSLSMRLDGLVQDVVPWFDQTLGSTADSVVAEVGDTEPRFDR